MRTESAASWLARQFAHTYCPDCGGDATHHSVHLVCGELWARCDFPVLCGRTHPVIVEYRAERGEPVDR